MSGLLIRQDHHILTSQPHSLVELNEIWMKITKDIYKSGRLIHYVDIDGKSYYSNFEEILINKFEEVREVDITTITKEKSFEITITEMVEYISRIQSEYPKYIACFYSEFNEQAKENLSIIVESINWLVHSILFLEELINEVTVESETKNNLVEVKDQLSLFVEEFSNQIELGNYVAVGDLLEYELLPMLDSFKQKQQEVGVFIAGI